MTVTVTVTVHEDTKFRTVVAAINTVTMNNNHPLSRPDMVNFFALKKSDILTKTFKENLLAGRSEDRIPVGDEIIRTNPGRSWDPPSLLHKGYRVFPGGKAAGSWC